MATIRSTAFVVGLIATAALRAEAQSAYGLNLEVLGGPATPLNPFVTIRVSARFGGTDHAFAASLFSVVAEDGGWAGSFPVMPPPLIRGTVVGDTLKEVGVGQVHFPPIVIANTANPIEACDVVWGATHFQPRTVRIRTITHRFEVYIDGSSPATASRLSLVSEAFAEVRVIPAPPSIIALLGGAMMLRGRRRRTTAQQSGHP